MIVLVVVVVVTLEIVCFCITTPPEMLFVCSVLECMCISHTIHVFLNVYAYGERKAKVFLIVYLIFLGHQLCWVHCGFVHFPFLVNEAV